MGNPGIDGDEERGGDGVLYVNPGSPLRPRGGFVPTIARLAIAGGAVEAEIVPVG
jgi:predicted phosphodiesterase